MNNVEWSSSGAKPDTTKNRLPSTSVVASWPSITVTEHGDLIVLLQTLKNTGGTLLRVRKDRLRHGSPYFDNLLAPGKFQEGNLVAAVHAHLQELHEHVSDAPNEALPWITISDTGPLSRTYPPEEVLTDFFRILHGLDLRTTTTTYLADIAVIADMFQSLPVVARYVNSRGLLQGPDAKARNKLTSGSWFNEERLRQRLLLGVLLDHPQWVGPCSKQLITGGPAQYSRAEERDLSEDDALWWNLPDSLENELLYRRECILDTINSVQSYFLKLYTTKQRQCKLGYDSSPQCDSFQLGEMIRFFTRIGTLRLSGILYDTATPESYTGDIEHLLEQLRQCPSYQIDRNHAHCGLRVRFLPILINLQTLISSNAAICGYCWKEDRPGHAWSSAGRIKEWKYKDFGDVSKLKGERACKAGHRKARKVFTAEERDWTLDT
ncbi:MAG: hypothetical protein M1827_001164 [Pycnora praestabilis]|nr:MAG: hypothetical protein M1827_001164 [Pycnora praestabilis]